MINDLKRKKKLETINKHQIEIRIKLYGLFRINRFKEEVRSYPYDVSARDVVEDLQLPEQLLGIIVKNDIHTTQDESLKDGDILSLFPLLGGG